MELDRVNTQRTQDAMVVHEKFCSVGEDAPVWTTAEKSRVQSANPDSPARPLER